MQNSQVRPVGQVSPEQVGQEKVFSAGALKSAVVGGLIFAVWSLISIALPCSTFSVSGIIPADRAKFIAMAAPLFFACGLVVGMVAYHFWRSPRRSVIATWAVVTLASGAFLGWGLLSLWLSATGAGQPSFTRVMMVSIPIAVIATGISGIFTGTRKLGILKGIFSPLALGLAVRLVLFSFVALDLDPDRSFRILHLDSIPPDQRQLALQNLSPWKALPVVLLDSCLETIIPTVVGVVVTLLRVTRKNRTVGILAGVGVCLVISAISSYLIWGQESIVAKRAMAVAMVHGAQTLEPKAATDCVLLLDVRRAISLSQFSALAEHSVYLTFSGKQCEPACEISGTVTSSKGTKERIRLFFVVPKDTLAFTLHLGDRPPIEFSVPNKIEEELEGTD